MFNEWENRAHENKTILHFKQFYTTENFDPSDTLSPL